MNKYNIVPIVFSKIAPNLTHSIKERIILIIPVFIKDVEKIRQI